MEKQIERQIGRIIDSKLDEFLNSQHIHEYDADAFDDMVDFAAKEIMELLEDKGLI